MSDWLAGLDRPDPHRVEHLWDTLYRGGPILMSAIAGIDQALWDLKGSLWLSRMGKGAEPGVPGLTEPALRLVEPQSEKIR